MDPFKDVFEEVEVREYLSVADLQRICDTKDLSTVQSMTTQVDLLRHSPGALGDRLPALTELRLNGSIIHSLRDLGTTLRSLRVLWVSRCGLEDVGGSLALPALEDLFMSYNNVSDLSQLSSLRNLRTLDAEGNAVTSRESVSFLQLCPNLQSVTLHANPIASQPRYRMDVIESIPQLLTLDDICCDTLDDVDVVTPILGLQESSVFSDISLQIDLEVAAKVQGSNRCANLISSLLNKTHIPLPPSVSSGDRFEGDGLAGLIREEIELQHRAADEGGVIQENDALTDRERVLAEMRSVATAVKVSQFCDPMVGIADADDDDDDGDDGIDLSLLHDNERPPSRPNGGAPARTAEEFREDLLAAHKSVASNLTHTSTVFCGNATRSLRTRKVIEGGGGSGVEEEGNELQSP